MATTAPFLPLGRVLGPSVVPTQMLTQDGDLLDALYVSTIDIDVTTRALRARLLIAADASFGIPGLPWLRLALSPLAGGTDLPVEVTFSPFAIAFKDLPIVARVDREILQPMRTVKEPDPTKTTTDIILGAVTLTVGEAGVVLALKPGITLPLCMVGSSGVVIQGGKIGWLSPGDPAPAGASDPPPAGFTGLYVDDAAVTLPDVDFLPNTIRFDDCYVGTGGFTGRVSVSSPLTWDPSARRYTTGMAGELFGFPCGVRTIEIGFRQSALQKGSLVGEMFLPYLSKRIGIELKLSLSGDFAVGLSAPPSTNPDPNVTMTGGILRLTEPGVVDAQLDSIAIERSGEDTAVRLGGRVRPLFAGVDWPTVGVKALTVHSDGRVEIGGGWLDLPQQKATSLHGFPLELRKVGFGSEPGRNWVGFSGGVKLIDGLPIGGGVEGLKLKWDPADPTNAAKWEIELAGIEVALDIPEVLALRGRVAFFEDKPLGKRWFQGSAEVTLRPLNCRLDAQLLVGRTPDYSFFYIFLEAGLPAGIPLLQTGLALYGLGGLFGYNVRPDRRGGEPWYEGWYKRAPVGPTDASKWTDERGKLVFGASVTLGTLPDNGFAVNARVLVIIVVPGPLILIEGKASVVKDRKDIAKAEPLFRALAVLDGGAGTFLLNVEPHYRYPAKAEMIEIGGVAEAFFDFNDSTAWYLNVGVRDPREKRIRAQILKLFQANAYFMLNARRVALGAYVGFDQTYRYGPVSVRLGYWFEGDAEFVYRPPQLSLDAGMHGRAEFKAFGIGLGVELDAQAHLSTATPYEVSALIHAKVDLPWPLPDPEITIPLEHKEPVPPPLPVPLQTVDVVTRKANESWDVGTTAAAPPLIPLDGKPVLVFAKSMHDDAGVGGNIQPAAAERAGDVSFDYHLDSVLLEKLEAGTWVAKAGRPAPGGGADVYGMWMPVTGGDQPPSTKLMLFVKTPFDAVRGAATPAAAEEFVERYPDYPCVVHRVDFEDAPDGVMASGTAYRGLTVTWDLSQRPLRSGPTVHDPLHTTGGRTRYRQRKSLWLADFTGPVTMSISLPQPAAGLRLKIFGGAALTLHPFRGGQQATTVLPSGETVTSYTGGTPLPAVAVHRQAPVDDHDIVIDGDGITRVEFVGAEAELFEIAWLEAAPPGGGSAAPGTSAHNAAETKRWAEEDFLLDPNAGYRLTTRTHVVVSPALGPAGSAVTLDSGPLGPASIPQGTGGTRYDFSHQSYFRTDGPPGFLGPDIDRRIAAQQVPMPADAGTARPARSLVRTLRPYVARTWPADGQTAVYRSYDPAVEFDESYVERMYANSGRTLTVSLRDRNGDPPSARVAGTRVPATVEEHWIDADAEHLTEADRMWATIVAESGCTMSLPPKPRDDQLTASLDGPVLAATTTYRATVEPVPATGAADRDLHSWSFTTSAFASFAHHIHSFTGRLWSSDASLDDPLPALGTAAVASLRAAVTAGDAAGFDTLATMFGRPVGAPLPARLELTLLRDAAQTWGFMVESPEPLDADRVTATLRRSAATTAESRHAGPLRIRDAAFGEHAGTAYNGEWVELIACERHELGELHLEHLRDPADHEDFVPLVTLTATDPIEPGDLVRVHAGEAPASAVDDGRRHLYLTPLGASPAWFLHAAGDICRLVDGDRTTMSSVELLPTYTIVPATWIWAADRTRAFVIPSSVLAASAPAAVPGGTYRVEWRFDLDVSAAAPDLPVLRRSGHSDPELAVSQFPV